MMTIDAMKKNDVVLFGAGKMARKFLMLYEDELPLATVVDNNEALHGKRFCEVMEGLPVCTNTRLIIQPPSALSGWAQGNVCVIVAVADARRKREIIEQLKGYGISVYVDVLDVMEVRIKEIQTLPIQKNKLVFQLYCHKSHDEAITEYLLHAFPAGTFDIVWLYKGFEVKPREGIRLVKADDSPACRQELATAQIVFQSDGSVTDQFLYKKEGQYYIELKHWASITLKAFYALEKWQPDHESVVAQLKRDAALLDYAFVGSDFDERTYRAGALYDGPCVRVGSPRSDLLFRKGIYEDVRTRLDIPQGVKLALYAPTFRWLWDSLAIVRSLDFAQMRSALAERFGGEWQVLLRLHPILVKRSQELDLPEFVRDVSHYDEGEELVAAADVMVSDYSSIIFESAFLYRPVFLYAPDKERYVQEERGFLLDYDRLPFPTSATNEALCASILHFDEDAYKMTLRAFFDKYGVHEDGQACERAAAFIVKLLGMDAGERDADA